MQTIHQAAIVEWMALVDKELEALTSQATSGQFSDLAQYKFCAGKIAGLRMAAELVQDAFQNVEKRT